MEQSSLQIWNGTAERSTLMPVMTAGNLHESISDSEKPVKKEKT
jgi:hypothetical protein